MKKIILLLLVTSSFLHASDGAVKIRQYSNNVPAVSLKDKEYNSLEDIVPLEKIVTTLANSDLGTFKTCEEEFKKKGLDILNIRVQGFSMLQKTIEYEPSTEEELKDKKKASAKTFEEFKKLADTPLDTSFKGNAILSYILSKVTGEQLNECVGTSFCITRKTYYGTAAAYAAMENVLKLEPILDHPLYDPTVFAQDQPVQYHRIEGYRTWYSPTPESCLKLHKQCVDPKNTRASWPDKHHSQRAVEILTKRFPEVAQSLAQENDN